MAPVYSLGAALDNPWLETIGMRDRIDHPDRKDMAVLASPIRLDGRRLANRAAPLLGADSEDVLVELGYQDDEIARLRAKGIV